MKTVSLLLTAVIGLVMLHLTTANRESGRKKRSNSDLFREMFQDTVMKKKVYKTSDEKGKRNLFETLPYLKKAYDIYNAGEERPLRQPEIYFTVENIPVSYVRKIAEFVFNTLQSVDSNPLDTAFDGAKLFEGEFSMNEYAKNDYGKESEHTTEEPESETASTLNV